MKKIVIFGCGQGAETATRYIHSDQEDRVCAYAVNRDYLKAKEFLGSPVVAFEEVEKYYPPEKYQFFIPLGFQDMNHLRAAKYFEAKKKGYVLYSYVSSKSHFHRKIECGENCFILEGQAINFDVKIGNNVVLWSSVHLGDRTVLGDHVWVSSHVTIAGDCVIKDYCFLGVNAAISNRVVLESETFVGGACWITQNSQKGQVFLKEGTRPYSADSRVFSKVLQASNKGS